MPVDPSQLIDLSRYPLDRAGSAPYRALIRTISKQLADDGCVVLKGFVRADKIATLVKEADKVAANGHRSNSKSNAYFTQDQPELAPSHPLRRFYQRSNAFVPADNFGPQSALRGIYQWPPFAPFIKQALGESRFYPYADPLADVIINTVDQGNGFPWHFDTNNFTVTLAIQNGESGGAFEYCPNIRTRADENYPAVEAVLDGERDLVRTLYLEPGDLQLFKGRYSLHRVTPVQGRRTRHVGIFSFVEEPGMVGSPERMRQLYGRVLPIHLERAGLRADALVD